MIEKLKNNCFLFSGMKMHKCYLLAQTKTNKCHLLTRNKTKLTSGDLKRINNKFDIVIEDLYFNCIKDEDIIELLAKRLNTNFKVTFVYKE